MSVNSVPAKVGDLIVYSWSGNANDLSHVAIITGFQGGGYPLVSEMGQLNTLQRFVSGRSSYVSADGPGHKRRTNGLSRDTQEQLHTYFTSPLPPQLRQDDFNNLHSSEYDVHIFRADDIHAHDNINLASAGDSVVDAQLPEIELHPLPRGPRPLPHPRPQYLAKPRNPTRRHLTS